MEIDRALFEIFMTEVQGYLDVLSGSTSGLVDLTDAAHGLKGASAMLGYQDLSRLAAALESRLKEGDTSVLADALEDIRKELERIQRKWSAGSHEPPPGGGGGQARGGGGRARGGAGKEGPAEAPAPSGGAGPTGGQAEATHAPVDKLASLEQSSAESGDDWDPETAAMLRQVFQEEAAEHLEQVSVCLEELEGAPDSTDAIAALFRATHTLKGAAGTVGLGDVSQAVHALESYMEPARSAGFMPHDVLATVRRAVDLLESLISSQGKEAKAVFRELLDLVAEKPSVARSEEPLQQTPAEPSQRHAKEGPPSPPDSEEGAPRDGPATPAGQRGGTYHPLPERRRTDRRAGGRREMDRRTVRVPSEDVDRLLDLLAELVYVKTRVGRRSDEMQGLAGDVSKTHMALRNALMRLKDPRALARRVAELEVELSDEAVNLDRASVGLVEEADQIGKLAAAFQESLIRLRMEPVSPLLTRLTRAALTCAEELGKDVEVQTFGQDVRLDKIVAERLVEPLVHLVRNAVAHGIEDPDTRRRLGKPPRGRIVVSATQEGDFVLLKVADDGQGIQWDCVRRRAVEQGVLGVQEARSAGWKDLLPLLFRPGFSTRRESDSVSGRGVGLDVVHETVVGMGGEVSVETRAKEGTEFLLRIPILAAINEALLFKVGRDVFAVSLNHVKETCLVARSELDQLSPTARLERRTLPVLDLVSLFGVERKARGRWVPGFVVSWAREEFVAACDKIVGPRQIVVRPLPAILRPLPYYSGATISGSGKVQLLLDPAALASALVHMPAHKSRVANVGNRGPKVLVCDDSRSVREVLTRILLEAGYDVEAAVDGWDAWERILVTDFQAVITDLEMPRMDGYALIERLRRSERFRDVPILVITSRTQEENRVRATELGASAFLAKPVKRHVVIRTLEETLERSGAGPAAEATTADAGS